MFFAIVALQVCLTMPTQNVDGSAIDDLGGFRLHLGQTSRNYGYVSDPVIETAPGIDVCYALNMAPGTYYVAATAFDTEGAVLPGPTINCSGDPADDANDPGNEVICANESAYSNEVEKIQIDTSPLPPVVIGQDETVFTVIKQPGQFVLIPIGIAPAGTVCDLNANAPRDYGTVANADVVWNCQGASCPRPIAVVARCDG
jgi:hypothetical protein